MVIDMKVMIDSGAFVPTPAHEEDAWLDLYAMDDQIIPARESARFDTGVYVQIPAGCTCSLNSTSGLNANHGITGKAALPAGYTGPVVISLYNSSGFDYYVRRGDKISQLLLIPYVELVETLEDATCGAGGKEACH